MAARLSKALTNINEAMPRARVELAIYKSVRMRDAVSRLYAHVLLFLQNAVEWYNKGSLRRALGSITGPLAFEDTIANIRTCTKAIDAIANTSSHIHISEINTTVKAQDRKLHDMQAKMNETQAVVLETQAQISQIVQITMSKSSFIVHSESAHCFR